MATILFYLMPLILATIFCLIFLPYKVYLYQTNVFRIFPPNVSTNKMLIICQKCWFSFSFILNRLTIINFFDILPLFAFFLLILIIFWVMFSIRRSSTFIFHKTIEFYKIKGLDETICSCSAFVTPINLLP